MRRTLPRSNPSVRSQSEIRTPSCPLLPSGRSVRVEDSKILPGSARIIRKGVVDGSVIRSAGIQINLHRRRPRRRSDRCRIATSGRRLSTAGAFIASGRRVSSRDKEPPLPRGSHAAASGSAATAGCRWTTSCCCDRWTGRGRSPQASTFRPRRPAHKQKHRSLKILHSRPILNGRISYS